MIEKVGLKIVELIHEITQLKYSVHFYPDFEGMVRIHYSATKPWQEAVDDLSTHDHVGFPDCERIVLEKQIIASLAEFRDKVKK